MKEVCVWCVYGCVCVCGCVCERERERERKIEVDVDESEMLKQKSFFESVQKNRELPFFKIKARRLFGS